jgi:hypothetical protein
MNRYNIYVLYNMTETQKKKRTFRYKIYGTDDWSESKFRAYEAKDAANRMTTQLYRENQAGGGSEPKRGYTIVVKDCSRGGSHEQYAYDVKRFKTKPVTYTRVNTDGESKEITSEYKNHVRTNYELKWKLKQ